MQKQKIFFIALIFLSSLVSVYFSIQSALAVYDFLALNDKSEAHAIRWEIKEVNGKFPIKCYYFFETGGLVRRGEAILAKPWHLNEAAAIDCLRQKAKEPLTVWFNSKRPDRSILERRPPTSLLFRTALSYGVLIYFVFFVRTYFKRYTLA